jgi:hypothetical protein
MARGAPDSAAMTAEQAKTKRESLAEWRTDLTALGALKSVRFQKVQDSGADLYDVDFENGLGVAGLVLDKDGRVSELWLDRR